jgi:cytochrome c-type biogenesis protein CcmH
MRALFILPLCMLLMLASPCSLSAEARPLAKDPAIEARMMAVAEELRCLVCQNQSLADSHSGLAEDLRHEMREMLENGKSDKEVTDFMVARYGDFVRYRPPFKASTALLWLGPFLLLLVAIIVLVRFFGPSSQEDSK